MGNHSEQKLHFKVESAKVVVAHGHTSIEVFNSMVPLILASEITPQWDWKFIDYDVSDLKKQSGNLLILVRKYHSGTVPDHVIADDLNGARENFDKIVYFDDSAAASVVLFNVFPFVDEYWKRSSLKDSSLYSKEFYGGHLFSDYYHGRYDIEDGDMAYTNQTCEEWMLEKLKVAWNIGAGAYPINRFSILNKHYFYVRKISTALSILPSVSLIRPAVRAYVSGMKEELQKEVSLCGKDRKISARFIASGYRNSIGFQRKLLIESMHGRDIFLQGLLSKWDFVQESSHVYSMLSPFGWGEICYRDFEAVLGGAYLIKPDMSHINTWPNIYQEGMYHSLNWDVSDMDELVNIFEDCEYGSGAVNQVRKKYLEAVDTFAERAIGMIESVSQ